VIAIVLPSFGRGALGNVGTIECVYQGNLLTFFPTSLLQVRLAIEVLPIPHLDSLAAIFSYGAYLVALLVRWLQVSLEIVVFALQENCLIIS
jgi:hypothetical protein